MKKRTYKVSQNPKTKSLLRNEEVHCIHCFENFGDLEILAMHMSQGENFECICLSPKSIPLTPQRNFSGAVVWRVTF